MKIAALVQDSNLIIGKVHGFLMLYAYNVYELTLSTLIYVFLVCLGTNHHFSNGGGT